MPCPPGWELWLDGGHNQAGGAALGGDGARMAGEAAASGLRHARKPRRRRVPGAAGAERRGLVTVAVPGEPATRSADNAAAAAREAGIAAVETAPDIKTALKQAAVGTPGRVLICGSLYLAGQVLALNK